MVDKQYIKTEICGGDDILYGYVTKRERLILFFYSTFINYINNITKGMDNVNICIKYDSFLSNSAIDVYHDIFLCNKIKHISNISDCSDFIFDPTLYTSAILKKCKEKGIKKYIVNNSAAMKKIQTYFKKSAVIGKIIENKNSIGICTQNILLNPKAYKKLNGLYFSHGKINFETLKRLVDSLNKEKGKLDTLYITGIRFTKYNINRYRTLGLNIVIILDKDDYSSYVSTYAKILKSNIFGKSFVLECNCDAISCVEGCNIGKSAVIKDINNDKVIYTGLLSDTDKDDYVKFLKMDINRMSKDSIVLVR